MEVCTYFSNQGAARYGLTPIWFNHTMPSAHQPEYESRVLTVELLLLHSFGFDLRRIANPQLET
jgi:hypothetical protein